MLRAIMYMESVVDFKKLCNENDIKYEEWTSNDEYEVRVSLCELEQEKLKVLTDFVGSKDVLSYNFLIIWQ